MISLLVSIISQLFVQNPSCVFRRKPATESGGGDVRLVRLFPRQGASCGAEGISKAEGASGYLQSQGRSFDVSAEYSNDRF